MSKSKIAGIAVATLFTVTPAAFAQTQAKVTDTTTTQTFTGCLMTEPAYRKAHDVGLTKDSIGIGLNDEYILVDITVSPAKEMAGTSTPRKSDMSGVVASASASTCADKGLAYRLSGKAEDDLKGLVGHQLEVQGRFQHADDAAAGGTRPGHELPAEVEIVSWREAPGPAAVSEPAPPPTTPVTPPVMATTPTRSTVEPAPVAAPPATTEPRELPRTASSSGLLALIGVLALCSGVAMTVLRRRAL